MSNLRGLIRAPGLVPSAIDAYQRRNRSAPQSPPGEHKPQAVSPGAAPILSSPVASEPLTAARHDRASQNASVVPPASPAETRGGGSREKPEIS
jgi:hypothetical protein